VITSEVGREVHTSRMDSSSASLNYSSSPTVPQLCPPPPPPPPPCYSPSSHTVLHTLMAISLYPLFLPSGSLFLCLESPPRYHVLLSPIASNSSTHTAVCSK